MEPDEDEIPEPEPGERRLNIHLDPADIAGVYANFANINFSRYEFTLTFARIEHEVEEGDVPGAVVARINASPLFVEELLHELRGEVDAPDDDAGDVAVLDLVVDARERERELVVGEADVGEVRVDAARFSGSRWMLS